MLSRMLTLSRAPRVTHLTPAGSAYVQSLLSRFSTESSGAEFSGAHDDSNNSHGGQDSRGGNNRRTFTDKNELLNYKIFKASMRGPNAGVSAYHAALESPEFAPSAETLDSLLSSYSKAGAPFAAVEECFAEVTGIRSLAVPVADAAAITDSGEPAVPATVALDENGLPKRYATPSVKSFNLLLRAAAQKGEKETVLDSIWQRMLTAGHVPNVFSYNYLMMGLSRLNNNTRVAQTLESMRTNGIHPNADAYVTLINHALANRDIPGALQQLHAAEEDRFPVPTVMLSSILTSAMQLDHADGCLQMLRRVYGSVGTDLDEGSLLHMLNVAARTKSVNLATEAWDAVQRSRYERTYPMYHALIQTYAGSGLLEKAYETLLEMRAAGLPCSVQEVGALVSATADNADVVDRAFYFLQEKHQKGVAVDTSVLNVVIRACAAMKDVDRAFATFQELHTFGAQPDIESCNAILHGCLRSRQATSALRFLQEMEVKYQIVPDGYSYLQVILAHLNENSFDQAIEILQGAAQKITVPQDLYALVVRKLISARRSRQAQALMDYIRESNGMSTDRLEGLGRLLLAVPSNNGGNGGEGGAGGGRGGFGGRRRGGNYSSEGGEGGVERREGGERRERREGGFGGERREGGGERREGGGERRYGGGNGGGRRSFGGGRGNGRRDGQRGGNGDEQTSSGSPHQSAEVAEHTPETPAQ